MKKNNFLLSPGCPVCYVDQAATMPYLFFACVFNNNPLGGTEPGPVGRQDASKIPEGKIDAT